MATWKALKNGFCAAALLGLMSTQAALAVPVLTVSATPSSGVVGSSVTVNVLISGIADLFGFQFSLGFNPAVLQANSVTEGAFLPLGGGTSFISGTINNATGSISSIADALSGFVPGVSGNGVLASISFTVKAVGTSPLSFSNALFLDSNLVDIAVPSQNGSFTGIAVVPEPASYALMALGIAGLALARRQALRAA